MSVSQYERDSMACRLLAVTQHATTVKYEIAEPKESVLISSGGAVKKVEADDYGRVAPDASILGKDLDSTLRTMMHFVEQHEPAQDLQTALREAAGWALEKSFIATFLVAKSMATDQKLQSMPWLQARGVRLEDIWFPRKGVYAFPKDTALGIVRLAHPGQFGAESPCGIAFRHTRCVFIPIMPRIVEHGDNPDEAGTKRVGEAGEGTAGSQEVPPYPLPEDVLSGDVRSFGAKVPTDGPLPEPGGASLRPDGYTPPG